MGSNDCGAYVVSEDNTNDIDSYFLFLNYLEFLPWSNQRNHGKPELSKLLDLTNADLK